ncbi:hypothetical protein RND81_04G098800 [Saponaria officinalis]|uniref:F-box domain-containing protein n=1 Tax=Saponaria officinalis TaxID=3572 RepID=A0AAW1LKG7_SAPOF
MRRAKKHAKHVEDPISGNCLDRISSLPDELLGHVLSFLPTRLAVTTSILSTRWRYLFTLTTCLSFEDRPSYGSYGNHEESEIIEAARCFKEFVDKVVESHRISPIKKFSLVCHGTYDKSDLNRWFTNALQKGVQELSYKLHGWITRVSDHDGFFMCETLKWRGSLLVKIVPSWKFSCSFDKAKLRFNWTEAVEYDLELDHQLLKAAANKATELRFDPNSIQDLLTLDDDEQMPDFHSLSSLYLGESSCDAWEYVISLLDKSPQLKTVIFDSGIPCCCTSDYNCTEFCFYDSWSPSDIPLDPFSCHVDEIRVYNFCGHKVPLLLIGHLLKNASALRNLTICTDFNDDPEEELKICKELLMLPRVSKDCCVQMK